MLTHVLQPRSLSVRNDLIRSATLAAPGSNFSENDSSVETRLERACLRDSASRENISARMRNQNMMNSISKGEIEADVDAVVRNDGSLDDLRMNTVKVIENLF